MKAILFFIPFWLFLGWLALFLYRLRRRGRRSPLNENSLRLPATQLRKQHNDAILDAALYMFGVVATPVFFYAMHTDKQLTNLVLVIVGVSVTVWFFVLAAKKMKQVIQMHVGIDAETAAGQELNLLMRDGAWVFHDIPYQYGNIDHVVIGPGGVFAVETKGYSKPVDSARSSLANATCSVQQGILVFPIYRTKAPIEQAKCHAKWLGSEIRRRFGLEVPVRPVVALPGWGIDGGFDGECWVINPKRGNALRAAVTRERIEKQTVDTIAAWVEDLARSVSPKSKEFDSQRSK